MNCIHCNEPGAHPGTRKCTDLEACHGRQEYARGVAAERARVVAWLRATDSECLVWFAAQRIEQGWHEEKP